MNDQRCGQCRFWGEKDDANQEWRQCQAVPHDEDGATDKRPFNGKGIEPSYPDAQGAKEMRENLAVVQDGSGYFAALKCRADFGCVLFEDKQEQPHAQQTTTP